MKPIKTTPHPFVRNILFVLLMLLTSSLSIYANDECINAIPVVPGLTCSPVNGTFNGSTLSGTAPACSPNASQDVWYYFTANAPTMQIQLNGTSGVNLGFEVISGGCGGPVVVCREFYGSGQGESHLSDNFIPGQTYYIRIFNSSATPTNAGFSFCVTSRPPPVNDTSSNAQVLLPGSSCNPTTVRFFGATYYSDPPSCAPNIHQDVWYRFTATQRVMSIRVTPPNLGNPGFEVIKDSADGQVVVCANAFSMGTAETYSGGIFVPGVTYYVRVFSADYGITTDSASICITEFPPPVNDSCQQASLLTPNTTCINTWGTFSGAALEETVLGCANGSSQDVWYRFTATDPVMSITLGAVSNLDHALQVYSGGCNGTLIACENDNNINQVEFYTGTTFVPGQNYYIRVLNSASSLSTLSFPICVRSHPTPTNDSCNNATTLTPQTSCVNTWGTFNGATLDATALGCANGSSQDVWYRFTATDPVMSITLGAVSNLDQAFQVYSGGCNGTLIACEDDSYTNQTEFYTSTQFVPGQTYYIRVLNRDNFLTTLSFPICVRSHPTPANDSCNNATTLTPQTSCVNTWGTFNGATLDATALGCANGSSQDVWYRFTATDPVMSITLGAVSNLDQAFQIYSGGCNGTLIACEDDNYTNQTEFYTSTQFVPGQTYHIRVLNRDNFLTTFSFPICVRSHPAPTNDSCNNAITLTPQTTCVNTWGTFSGATLNGTAPSCATATSQDVWYTFTATSANMTVSLGAISGLNHGFVILQGSCSGNVIVCRNSQGSGNSESYTGTAFIPGEVYFIRVFNASGTLSSQAFNICVTGLIPSCVPSVTITAPQTTICQGSPLTFTATPVHGGSAPAYQWKINGINAGSNDPFFTTNSLANGDVVSCILTSNASCANPVTGTSNSITITVTAPVTPQFTAISPICSGGSFTLPNTSVNGINGTWSPQPDTLNTTTYTFQPDAGQCATAQQLTVTVQPIQTPVFNPIPAICAGHPLLLPNASANGIAGTWSPPVNNMTTTSYTFQPAGGQCATQALLTVTVNAWDTAVFAPVAAICSGDPLQLPTTSANGISGTWWPVPDNTVTTTYTFTAAAGYCVAPVSLTVPVTPSVTPQFTSIPDICLGEIFTLPAVSNNGISGSWSPPVNLTATTTYLFTPAAGACTTQTSLIVMVNQPEVPAFFPIDAICYGQSFSLPGTSLNGIQGTWSPPVNSTATTTYQFTPDAGACATQTDMTVTVHTIDTTVSVSGYTLTAWAPGADFQWVDCAMNYLPVPGETASVFQPADEGVYAVIISQNGCSDTSSCFPISFTGLQQTEGWEFRIFPNPADDIAYISGNVTQLSYTLFNQMGMEIRSGFIQHSPEPVNLSDLAPGVYYIRIENHPASLRIIRR